MSTVSAVRALFVAFGATRQEEQAQLYAEELAVAIACQDCAEVACESLMRTAKRLPSLSQVLEEAHATMASDTHTLHVTNPQLAPRSETWWRTEAVKLILPKATNDRNLAALIAAQMWWSGIEATLHAVGEEVAQHGAAWVTTARTLSEGKDPAALTEAAFRRARWPIEHPLEEMPKALLDLLPEVAA